VADFSNPSSFVKLFLGGKINIPAEEELPSLPPEGDFYSFLS